MLTLSCSFIYAYSFLFFINKELSANENTSFLNDSSSTIGYNLLARTEERIDNFRTSSLQTISPPFLGNILNKVTFHDDTLKLSYPFPPDDRVKINLTSSYPWSTICKLFITADDDTEWIGSGAMLDEFHILTCGHCVYTHENGGWVKEVKVVPGMNSSYEPFGHAYATYFRTYTQWIQDEMFQHDWAVVTLDRTIGNQTGWMGRKTADPLDSIYTGTLHTAGYPGDLDLGLNMYYDSDVGEDADNYNHWYWMDSAPGQSGGPVWEESGGNYYILTINAYEYENGTYANMGTRLNQDKFDQINIWLEEDTPPDDNSNGTPPDNSFLISTFIAVGVIAAVSGLVIVSVRRSKPELPTFEPSQEDIPLYREESELSEEPQEVVKICPVCGQKIMRDSQRFCTSCGYEFINTSDF